MSENTMGEDQAQVAQETSAPAPAPAPAVETDDAILDRILGGVPSAPTEQPRPEPTSSAEAEPEASIGEAEIDLTPLTLIGVPKSVLETMPKPALQEWSAQVRAREAKRSTDIQQRSEELKQIRDELGRFKAQKQESAEVKEPSRPTLDSDLDAELKPIVDELRDLGVPAGEKLAAVLKGLKSSHAAQVEGLASTNQQLAREIGEFFIDQSRSQLAVQYPQLSDEAVFEKVREEMDAQMQTGRYQNLPFRKAIAAALNTSAKVVLFDDIVKAQSEKVHSNNRNRMLGQPTAPTRPPEATALTPEERDDKIADLLIAGKLDEAKRLARG